MGFNKNQQAFDKTYMVFGETGKDLKETLKFFGKTDMGFDKIQGF